MSVTDPNAQIGDDLAVVLFLHHAMPDELASRREGRPICFDREVCEIRFPGSRNYSVHPATERSHWRYDQFTGETTEVTYAERFSRQYQQFKAKLQQTKRGTNIDDAPFLTAARRAELKAQNVYTVEMLAAIEGQELKNLGPGGREMKTQATEYMDSSKLAAPTQRVNEELELLRQKLQMVEEDNAIMKNKLLSGEAQFEAMSNDALRAYIIANQKAGVPAELHGNVSRKTLMRLAFECRPAERVA